MKLASMGFSTFDQELLVRQLKIVGGHTAVDWLYVGEDSMEADVLIVRALQDAGGGLEALEERFQGVIAMAGEMLADNPSGFRLEWPIRVFSLLGLLDAAEGHLAHVRRAPATLEQLVNFHQDGWLWVNGSPVLLQRSAGMLRGAGSSFEGVLMHVQSRDFNLLREVQYGAFPGPVVWECSIERLLWALALRAENMRPRWSLTGQRFHLSSYPHFEEWEVNPLLLRLAALYSRYWETIAEGCRKTGAPAEQVRAFLYACEICQLGLESHEMQPAEEAPATATETVVSGVMGFLGRLRSRLGLGLARS